MVKSTLSVLIPTKDSERHLNSCIKSVSSIADEIIVLDSYSEDDTISIVESFEKTEIVQSSFKGFGELRRELLSFASCKWVLFLDSDEVVSSGLASEINQIISSRSTTSYRIPRKSKIFGEWMFEPGRGPLRLGQRTDFSINSDDYVHELLQTEAVVKSTSEFMIHYNYSSIHEYIVNMNQYTSLEALQIAEEGDSVSLFGAVFDSILTFAYYLIFRKTILKGISGFAYATLSGFYEIITYLKYKELMQNKKNDPDSWKQDWISEAAR
jgi:glycosyltransferase involved in cell wall biosynthesis